MRKNLLILFLLSFFPCVLMGQTVPPDRVAGGETFAAHGYKAEDINSKVKALELRTDLNQADKDKLSKLYTDSLDRLREIESLKVIKEDYDNKTHGTPDELVKFKGLLSNIQAEDNGYESSMSLEQMEQKLAAFQIEFSQIQKESSALANEPQRRATRRTEIPKEIIAINDQLLKSSDKSVDVSTDLSLDEIKQASNVLKTLTEDSLKAKASSLESELAMYNARGDLLTIKRDYYAKKQQVLTEQVKKWEELVNERRKKEAQTASRQAQEVATEVASNYPILTNLSQENLEIAKKQVEIAVKIEKAGVLQKEIDEKLQGLTADYDQLSKRVSVSGQTTAIGYLLNNKRLNLPDINANKRNIKARLEEMSQTMFELLDYDEQKSKLDIISDAVALVMFEVDLPEGRERQDLAVKVEELLTTRRSNLETLVSNFNSYSSILTAIDDKEREFITQFRKYENFINEHILWVKNAQPISLDSFRQVGPEIKHIFSVTNLWQALQALAAGIKNSIIHSVCLWLLLILSFMIRYLNRRKMHEIAAKVLIPETDSLTLTFEVLLLTIFYSVPIPLMIYIMGWTLQNGAGGNEFVLHLASACLSLALYDIVLLPLRNIFVNNGLAMSHFGYSQNIAKAVFTLSSWFIFILQPLLLILYLQHNLEDADLKYQFSRLVFLVIMVLFSLYLTILLYPNKGVMGRYLVSVERRFLTFQNIICFISIITPLSLAVIAWQGYFYAAWKLEARMFAAFGSGLVFVLIYSLANRRIQISRKKIITRHMEKKKGTHDISDEEEFSEEEVGDYCDQICRFMRFVLSFGYLISLLVIFRDVFPALAVLDKKQLWQVTGDDGVGEWVTLASVLSSLSIFIITILMARNISGLINITLLKSISNKEGTRFAILALTRYVIVIVGVFWSFAEIGIGWGEVQWLAAAFTVGLGFGLQEIFANFMSGLILLFEQPMRVGDIVTVGEVSGKVTHINTRSTTINCWDRRELIIPNKEFITGKLINWTLSDNLNRIVFKVGVAYGSDIEKVEKTLMRIARFRKGVVWKPKPTIIFRGFGDSCLDFELRVYINDMEDYLEVWHGVNCAIDSEFRKEKIEIAFPQRDLHIRSVNCEPFPIRMERPLVTAPQVTPTDSESTNIEGGNNESN